MIISLFLLHKQPIEWSQVPWGRLGGGYVVLAFGTVKQGLSLWRSDLFTAGTLGLWADSNSGIGWGAMALYCND